MSCLKFNEKGTYLTIRKLAEGYLKEREKEVTEENIIMSGRSISAGPIFECLGRPRPCLF